MNSTVLSPSTESSPSANSRVPHWLVARGEMAERMANFPWESTPLGSLETWPQSLRTAVSIMLSSQHPMWIGWGPRATFLYNDAYVSVLSLAKHPWALGRPAEEVWAEIWDFCGPLARRVFEGGDATYVNDVQLFMNRGGFIEETYYSFSYSPIPDETGRVGGLFCPSTEVSSKVLNARRLATLSELSANALIEKTVERACSTAFQTLGKNTSDVPFCVLYFLSSNGQIATRTNSTGLPHGQIRLASEQIVLGRSDSFWPLEEVVASSQLIVADLPDEVEKPIGAASLPVKQAAVVPVKIRGDDRPYGLLLIGINPTRRFDAEYRTFFELISGQLATAIQNARAAEEDRLRADQLSALDQAKTAFFSNVSHELRTPLTLMLGPLEDELHETRGSRERLDLAYRNSLRLLKLVNRLLDFSRIEAGKADAIFTATNLATYTADLASVFRSTTDKAGLRLLIDCPPLSAPVFVDRGMWEKVVFNLLSNAFKFTLKGEIEVKVEETISETSGRVAKISVRDTGSGMPASELPRIFDRFHRIRNSFARSHEGTGIGLALVHELIRMHGGEISVASTEGAGTTFTVLLPFGTKHLPADRIDRSTTDGTRDPRHVTVGAAYVDEAYQWLPPTETASPFREGTPRALAHDNPSEMARTSSENGIRSAQPRVLLADDNADMREYVRRLLNERGYDVTLAVDGQAALESALSAPPALVLSDVMMPRLDGFGLLSELRKHDATRTIPIILLSARAGEESRVEGVEAGADDYLTKPFSARELLARVETHLSLAQARREIAEAKEAQRQRLEETVAERTSKLRESIAELESFSYSIAHDMRAPLRSLHGFSEILLAEHSAKLEPEAQTYLRRIAMSADRMDKLIQDVLSYSRILRGELALSRVNTDQLLRGIVETYPMFSPEIADIQIEGLLAAVLGNEAMITQVFSNLLGNSIKFVRPGERPRIRISSSLIGGHVRFSVADAGIGIPEGQREKIFGIFHQLDQSKGGTGIGLSIVKKAIERMGGRVGVDANQEGGSTFWFELQQA